MVNIGNNTGLTIIKLCYLSVEIVRFGDQFNFPRLVKDFFYVDLGVKIRTQYPCWGLYPGILGLLGYWRSLCLYSVIDNRGKILFARFIE
jgi:hypothetical protein